MSRPALDRVSEQAIDWMVELRAATPDPALLQRVRLWLQQDPAHQQAWNRLEQRLGHPFAALLALDQRAPGQAAEARRLLMQPTRSRREVLGAMASLGLFGAALWGGWRSDTAQGWLADLHTGRGERRSFTLADGSRLSLNSASAVDVQFDAGQRLLMLRHGELLIQVARDPLRPLRVRTAQGQVQALGTRFLVSQEQDATRVVVLQHSVRASLADGQWAELHQGQAALLRSNTIERLTGEQQQRAAWLEGRLEVLDQPLHVVVDALRPYLRGYIRLAPAARDLRVQGVFPLDQPQQAFKALAEALPISVARYGPWLILIDVKTA
ncbi:FecR family protein [Pseudomonas sp. GD03651]|jgi:transmembrane sensor|uniref:FecR domain-containing protein n=1 Tax=Pseudomonas TaxID=286 RepID=UPI00034F06B1|nr:MULTISPECIES: FecR family protein [Pseudomonas]HDS1813368.1 FecR family protein [Pseudomonas putida]AGN81629.1 anti-FecI sigma factor FecR [Pseudomonas putida H8234]MCE0965807.1 FecR family protein [Pseudomonas sp. NMI4491_12]MDH2183545.1 FecR family protein [Pseudomonas sp. GD03651]HDS3809757.1 FecR family protein [Pseudomonas putida]